MIDSARRVLAGSETTKIHNMPDLGLYWETLCTPIRDASGVMYGAIGIATNVTKRVVAEQELQRFLEVSPEMFCTAGTDGYFKSLSPAFERILGWSKEE